MTWWFTTRERVQVSRARTTGHRRAATSTALVGALPPSRNLHAFGDDLAVDEQLDALRGTVGVAAAEAPVQR